MALHGSPLLRISLGAKMLIVSAASLRVQPRRWVELPSLCHVFSVVVELQRLRVLPCNWFCQRWPVSDAGMNTNRPGDC